MNVIFFAQSRALDVFYELWRRARSRLDFGRVGFYVSNLRHYESFLEAHPDFEREFVVLKEADIYAAAVDHSVDRSRIARYEEEIGDPTLWGPVVTDRRLYMGRKTTFRQDYRPRFSHEEILAILDVALVRIDDLFRRIQPDLICTIYTATFGDCLGHLFAKARGVRALDLRLSRLKNYVMFVDGVVEPPPHIRALYEEFGNGVPTDLRREAEEYLASMRGGTAIYEGVVPAGGKGSVAAGGQDKDGRLPIWSLPSRCFSFLKRYGVSRRAPYCYDYQNPDMALAYLYSRVLNRIHLRRLERKLGEMQVGQGELRNLDYVLYPLHTEPELVLAQFARPYLNQIEVIRNISLSIPMGMLLLVKEHPMMLGRRSFGYYRKLLDIPNVRLVDFRLPSEVVLEHARLVVILRGAIGLEAALRKKPVVTLGQSMFDLLPTSMLMPCRNPYDLAQAIRGMLDGYRYEHEALVRYLAAVMEGSVAVNLVSDLLGKKGRFRAGAVETDRPISKHPHMDMLADYLVRRVAEGTPVEVDHACGQGR